MAADDAEKVSGSTNAHECRPDTAIPSEIEPERGDIKVLVDSSVPSNVKTTADGSTVLIPQPSGIAQSHSCTDFVLEPFADNALWQMTRTIL